MKDLRFITCLPDDTYYTWQVHLWLENLKELGYSDKAVVIIYTPKERKDNPKWKQIEDLYPESEFVHYKDEHENKNLVSVYIPVLRPYVMWRYFTDHPEMKEKAIFYYDSDVLLTEKFDISHLLDDDINYVSDTRSYVGALYFDSKEKDVIPQKLNDYRKIDVLDTAAKLVGIDRQICEDHENDSGGAQYLLKNLDADFWEKVKLDCIKIRIYLQQVNRQYFANENRGFQSWCSDMWAVLWNLWLRGAETKIVRELDFAWASDPVTKLETMGIFHNAGVVSTSFNGVPAFYKAKYHTGTNPVNDPHLKVVMENEGSKKWCTWWYANKLLQVHDKYKLNY